MMVESFLPAMRTLVARRLHREGFSQGKIASMLGITQASVSLYLSMSRSRPMQLISSLGISEEEAERYSALLSEDVKKNPAYAVSTLYSIWSNLLGKGLMCHPHRAEYAFLSHCDICLRTFGRMEAKGEEAMAHVSEAVSIMESSGSLVHVMPEISVNIAYAQGEATSVDDVVAIPGRIVRVKDRVRSFMKPEFGASKHLALILLLARSRMGRFRSAINLRYDERMESVLKKLRLKTLRIEGGYPKGVEDPVAEALRARMSEARGDFDALVAVGGQGLEPSLYLFAENAVEAARLAIRVAKAYSEAR